MSKRVPQQGNSRGEGSYRAHTGTRRARYSEGCLRSVHYMDSFAGRCWESIVIYRLSVCYLLPAIKIGMALGTQRLRAATAKILNYYSTP